MNLKANVKKLERDTGINAPCAMCDLVTRFSAALGELDARLGVALQSPPSTIDYLCKWCGRSRPIPCEHYTPEEAEIARTYFAAFRTGTLCAPEVVEAEARLTALLDDSAHRTYGESYEEYRQVLSAFESDMNRVADEMGEPKILYVCRVEGCTCDNAKTIEEARQIRAKRRRAA